MILTLNSDYFLDQSWQIDVMMAGGVLFEVRNEFLSII
jgi:hypothetical protein